MALRVCIFICTYMYNRLDCDPIEGYGVEVLLSFFWLFSSSLATRRMSCHGPLGGREGKGLCQVLQDH